MGIKFAQYTTATAAPGGLLLSVQEGEAWAADDPLVVAHPELFADTPARVYRSNGRREVVEQATAAPGEKRK